MTDQSNDGIVELAQRLVADAKNYAQAEYIFYRSIARERAREAGAAGAFFAVAAAIANATLIAALMALTLWIAKLFGFGLALVLILFGGLLVTAILALIGYLFARKLSRPIRSEGDQ